MPELSEEIKSGGIVASSVLTLLGLARWKPEYVRRVQLFASQLCAMASDKAWRHLLSAFLAKGGQLSKALSIIATLSVKVPGVVEELVKSGDAEWIGSVQSKTEPPHPNQLSPPRRSQ